MENILATGRLSSPYALRIGLIAYRCVELSSGAQIGSTDVFGDGRDHPPQDNSFVTRCFPFSSDPAEVKEHLKSLYASGGGDGPEGGLFSELAIRSLASTSLTLSWPQL